MMHGQKNIKLHVKMYNTKPNTNYSLLPVVVKNRLHTALETGINEIF